jgi:transposase
MGNKVGKATENVRNRMSFRQRRLNDDSATEYSEQVLKPFFTLSLTLRQKISYSVCLWLAFTKEASCGKN